MRVSVSKVSFSERLVRLFHRTATGTRLTRNLLTPIGVLVFGLFTVSFVLFGLLLDQMLRLPWPIPTAISRTISIPVIVIGVAITAWSVLHFLKVKGTPVPFNPPPVLVDTGPYRYARNPMLTGVFLMLFGVGFAVGSLSLLFLFTPLYILANLWELRNIEEPELEQRLGEDYVTYRNTTPMFVPKFSRRK